MEYELIVRKTVSSFIEKILRYCGNDISHDRYKEIIYNEKPCETKTEEKIKSYYDGYMYLLNNANNVLTHSIVKTFFYIVYKRQIEENIVNKIVNKNFNLEEYSPIEKAIELHIYVEELMVNYEKTDKMLIPLMIFNYVLVNKGIPSIKLIRRKIIEYERIRNEKNKLYIFFKELISEYKYIPKEYIKNLEAITLKEIVEGLKEEKDILKSKYQVKKLILHGSFVKQKERIDSDIDMIIKINMDLTYRQRLKIIEELKEYLTKKFKRYVDIEEINTYLDEEFMQELKEIKIII